MGVCPGEATPVPVATPFCEGIHSRGGLRGTSGADSHHLGKMSTSAAKGKVLCLEPKHLLLGGFAHHHFPGLCLTIMGCDDGVLTGR